jgi:hypothetical protein
MAAQKIHGFALFGIEVELFGLWIGEYSGLGAARRCSRKNLRNSSGKFLQLRSRLPRQRRLEKADAAADLQNHAIVAEKVPIR